MRERSVPAHRSAPSPASQPPPREGRCLLGVCSPFRRYEGDGPHRYQDNDDLHFAGEEPHQGAGGEAQSDFNTKEYLYLHPGFNTIFTVMRPSSASNTLSVFRAYTRRRFHHEGIRRPQDPLPRRAEVRPAQAPRHADVVPVRRRRGCSLPRPAPFRRIRARPLSGLRTTVERPEAGLPSVTLLDSTLDVRACLGLIPSSR